jgi:hypothetical protein
MNSSRNRLWLIAVALLLTAVVVLIQQNGKVAPTDASTAIASPPASSSSSRNDRTSRPVITDADRLLQAEGALTDIGLSSFPIKEYKHVTPPAGKAYGAPSGEAFIHIPSAGRRVAMESNQLGEYPSVETLTKETVGVRLELAAVKPGTPVRIVIMDGGTFPKAEGSAQVVKATEWGGVAFEYTVSPNIGTHRILVQAVGQPSRILDFTALEAKAS